jgi:hypothetical protein
MKQPLVREIPGPAEERAPEATAGALRKLGVFAGEL